MNHCPVCGNDKNVLDGKNGRMLHYHCSSCGYKFSNANASEGINMNYKKVIYAKLSIKKEIKIAMLKQALDRKQILWLQLMKKKIQTDALKEEAKKLLKDIVGLSDSIKALKEETNEFPPSIERNEEEIYTI